MNYMYPIKSYITNLPVISSSSSYVTSVASFVTNYFCKKPSKEFICNYTDTTEDNKQISLTKIYYHHPKPTHTTFKHYESLEALCTHIARTRTPFPLKSLKKEISSSSFSSVNRGDISTEVSLSKSLKKLIGLENKTDQEIKDFLKTESSYKHNSEFNGYSYTDQKGKLVQIDTATASSADRESSAIQNLTVVKSGGRNLLYTGRPDTLEKAKEQALFILSHKLNIPLLEEASSSETVSKEKPIWLNGKKGITWNPKEQCIELPYALYSIMSDSDTQHAFYNLMNDPANNEKLFIKKEVETLKKLKNNPVFIKDESGKVFKLQCKPILLSQCFNAFETFKGIAAEGSLSPIIMREGWDEIHSLIKKTPEKLKKVQQHVEILNNYFSGSIHLSSIHLFLHMNIILSEINGVNESLPIVLHCKSSTDRTGIGAAILATLGQFKSLKIPIPSDLNLLTSDLRFKELFFLNWAPTWHQRSKYSRDILGISFGAGLQQNPILVDCLPKRFLKDSSSKFHNIKSGFFAGINFLGLRIYHCFSKKVPAVSLHAKLQLNNHSYLPKLRINEKAAKFRSVGQALSPLQKSKKNELLFSN